MDYPLTPGRIVYLLCHLPLAEARRSVREGGPWQQWLDRRGRDEMRGASRQLPTLPDFGPAVELHQLTGRNYAFESLFCLWTFAHAARRSLAPVFYDDGTLTPSQRDDLLRVFPHGHIVSHDETLARLETHLPANRFPILRERFARYVFIRKLINPHLGSTGWKLTLDADLLFFRRPDFLLDWLDNPSRPLYMLDIDDAYGYPSALLEKLAGHRLPRCLNVGICGLRSELIDWERLEAWCAELLQTHGSHYLLEQALTALLLAPHDCAVAPAADYLTFPSREEALSPKAVMHHYVSDSKRWYFRHSWKLARGKVAKTL